MQDEYARRVGAIHRLKATHRASLAEMDVLFASLHYRAFRGELYMRVCRELIGR